MRQHKKALIITTQVHLKAMACLQPGLPGCSRAREYSTRCMRRPRALWDSVTMPYAWGWGVDDDVYCTGAMEGGAVGNGTPMGSSISSRSNRFAVLCCAPCLARIHASFVRSAGCSWCGTVIAVHWHYIGIAIFIMQQIETHCCILLGKQAKQEGHVQWSRVASLCYIRPP